MGTVAVSVISQDVFNDLRTVIADVTFSASYATGGDTVPIASLGLKEVVDAFIHTGILPTDTGVVASNKYTPNTHGVQAVLAGKRTAPLLKAVAGAAGSGAEVTNATNLSAVPAVRILFRGH